MINLRRWAAVAAAVTVLVGSSLAEESAPAVSVGRPMPFETARDKTAAWVAGRAGGAETRDAVARIWETAGSESSARDVQDLVARSFAAADPAVAAFFDSFDLRRPLIAAPDAEALLGTSEDAFFRANAAIHAGRLLTDARFYDEAHAVFEAVEWSHAVDPASGLFYKAVCEHQLLLKDEGLKTLALLDAMEDVPESYSAVARLMRAELEALEPESLGEVAGLMRDVERRLDLARGGQRVQKKEDEIAAKLDEMIKKIEQQMSQSSSAGGGGSGNGQPSNPLGDSIVKGATAPGEVDPRSVSREGGWGDLPPREREQARNEIEKAFPSNYGRLINEYFLKRARGERPSE